MGIYTSGCPFSLEGEGRDEGEYNQLILFSSPPTLSSRRGSLALLQPIVFTVYKSCVDTYARRERA